MSQITLYGIPNCDTVKKARRWLEAQGCDYAFHDYKKEGADREQLARWIEMTGVDTVLNRRGTTFRKLSEAEQANIDPAKAVTLLEQHPSMIKRPIVEYAGGVLVGFKEDEWRVLLK
ncbi:MAG: ArsC family reductase [Erythrobacter sp.]